MGDPARGAALAPAGGHRGHAQGLPRRQPGDWTGIIHQLLFYIKICLVSVEASRGAGVHSV